MNLQSSAKDKQGTKKKKKKSIKGQYRIMGYGSTMEDRLTQPKAPGNAS